MRVAAFAKRATVVVRIQVIVADFSSRNFDERITLILIIRIIISKTLFEAHERKIPRSNRVKNGRIVGVKDSWPVNSGSKLDLRTPQ